MFQVTKRQMTMTTNQSILTLILLITLQTVHQQEIKITSLETNPGILPFHLGNARIRQFSHEFIHYFDILPILEQIKNIKVLHNNFIKILELETHEKYNSTLLNFNQHILYLFDVVNTKFKSIYPFDLRRTKRGLINALGSVVKFISGNLDHDDAIRYENAIKELYENQDKIVKSYNKQMTLNTDLMNWFNETFLSVQHNDEEISNKINTLSNDLVETKYKFKQYMKLRDVLDQIANNLNSLIHFLTDIENAISFAKLNTVHHSILKLSEIQVMIDKMLSIYNKDQLIFYETRDIYNYYNLIKVKAYYSDTRLVFALEIPVVYPEIFNYYHLYSIPTKDFTTIIPRNPYLASNEGLYQYQQEECLPIDSIYYCSNTQLDQLDEQQDCISTILSSRTKTECHLTRLKIDHDIIEQINPMYYIVIFKSESEIHTNCQKKDIISIKNTHLIELPYGCSFTYNQTKFVNEKSYIASKPLYLPNINVPQIKTHKEDTLEFNVNKISLDKLNDLKLSQQKLEINHNFKEYISNHYILLIIVVILILLMIVIFKIRKCLKCLNFKCFHVKKKENQKSKIDLEMKINPSNFHS